MNAEIFKECKSKSSLTKLEIKLNIMPSGNTFDKTDNGIYWTQLQEISFREKMKSSTLVHRFSFFLNL